jgi:salicylate hydroxylase
LLEWAREPHVVDVYKTVPLEDWFHPDGPYALVGHAAQPLAVSLVRLLGVRKLTITL